MALRRFPSASFVLAAILACGHSPRAASGVVDDWGRAVSATAPIRRIVSLSPATTELVFALGFGDRLAGRTHWCDWPPESRRVPDLGSGIGPNVEAVAAQRPDLVLLYASEANRPALASLERLHIPTAVVRVDLAGDVRRTTRLVAALLGQPAAADSVISRFDHALREASVRERAARPARVYVDVGDTPPITVGRGSYLSEVLAAAGAENVFGDIHQPSAPVSLEAIVERDPDAILVLADSGRVPDVAARAGWSAVRAVRLKRIIVADGSLYGRPSPRMGEAVRDLRQRLAVLGWR